MIKQFASDLSDGALFWITLGSAVFLECAVTLLLNFLLITSQADPGAVRPGGTPCFALFILWCGAIAVSMVVLPRNQAAGLGFLLSIPVSTFVLLFFLA